MPAAPGEFAGGTVAGASEKPAWLNRPGGNPREPQG